MTLTIQGQVLKYYKCGQDVPSISKKIGIDKSYAYCILRKNKIKLRKNLPPCMKYIGQTFGYLKIFSIIIDKKDDHRSLAVCKCLNCGKTKKIRVSNLLDKTTKSCGCLSSSFVKEKNGGKNSSMFKGYEEISGQFWGRIKRHAVSRGLSFKVDIADAWKLYLKQDKKCALSGLPIYFGKTNTENKTISLDRIDSSKGYCLDNIQWIHKNINKMKNSFSQDFFINCCRRVASYDGKKRGDIDYRIKKEIIKQNYRGRAINRKGYKDISGAFWSILRWGAKIRKLPFRISLKYVWKLFKKNGNFCSLSGLPIYFGQTYTIRNTASLDRINSDKGYIKGNVQWINKNINIMKMEFKEKYFREICKMVSNNSLLKNVKTYDDYEMFLLSDRTINGRTYGRQLAS